MCLCGRMEKYYLRGSVSISEAWHSRAGDARDWEAVSMESFEERKPNVLVVEDERGTAELIRMMLRARGYATELVESGAEAIALLDAMGTEVSPWRALPIDLVLLDIMMPGVDGFKICQLIKEHDLMKHIPVIMVTALDSASDKVAAVEFGADDYITKPFLPEELHAAIKAKLQVKSREELLIRRNVELEAINAVSAAALSTLDPQRVAVQAFEALIDKTGFAGAIYTMDEETGLQLIAQSGVERDETPSMTEGVSGRAIQTHQAVLQANLPQDPDSPLGGTSESRSMIGTPLCAGEACLGYLEIYHSDPYGFDEGMRSFVAEVGERIGMALQNAEIFQRAQLLLIESSSLNTNGA